MPVRMPSQHHDMRHTWASHLLHASVDPKLIQEWAGWHSIKMLDRYGHLDRKDFCVVGRDCQLWEEVMDELVVGPTGEGDLDLTTTSHTDESVEEVIAFAESWNLDERSGVQVIEI